MITSRAIRHVDFHDRMLCSIAAAVLGAGALSAGASIWGSSKAADAQTNAADKSIANQQQMFNITNTQNKNALTPFINAGQGGIGQLQDWINPTSGNNPLAALIKLVTPGADQSATLAQTPGYQFSAGQGTRAALNALAARGLGGSPGAIAKGVSNYNQGLAGSTFQSAVQNLLSTFGVGTNALQGLVNTGASAGGSLAGVSTNLGNSTSNAISNAITGAGNAQAAGYNAAGSAVGGLGNSLTTASLLQSLTNGGGGGGGIYGNPAFGGNGVWGGSSANPLQGLSKDDYGEGY